MHTCVCRLRSVTRASIETVVDIKKKKNTKKFGNRNSDNHKRTRLDSIRLSLRTVWRERNRVDNEGGNRRERKKKKKIEERKGGKGVPARREPEAECRASTCLPWDNRERA